MFKKKTPDQRPTDNAERDAQVPKFDRPKILLVDLAEDAEDALRSEGYNVHSGSFGSPYKVDKGSHYNPVILAALLPNYTEQEIVIVDLKPRAALEGPSGDKLRPNEEFDWWAKCSRGIVDPRPVAMSLVREKLDRILQNGGAFVIFADGRDAQQLVWACADAYKFSIAQKLDYDNWSLLSVLSDLTVSADHGKEIKPVGNDHPLVRLLGDHLGDGEFTCTFEPGWGLKDRWVPLAKNKYGATVAAVIPPAGKTKAGWVFLLPRISRPAEFLAAFLKNILPDLAPLLFPHAQGKNWAHRIEYALPTVLESARQISDIQDEAARKVEALEKVICAEREKNQFLYELIQGTGNDLVRAVKEALRVLGFVLIVDVDEEMKLAGTARSLREDLRVHDLSPILVVDVKGVAGRPADAEALQAQKHAFIYIQEQGRADVRGLTIINHQRLLPPLDRENDMPFRKEILDNAGQLSLGLMTTWDLFRLTRGLLKNGWNVGHVKPLFYNTGRILPIPTHYEYVGRVKQVWKPAFSVHLEASELRVGERLAIEFPVDFEEQEIASLQLNDASVALASAGSEVGIARGEHLPPVKTGYPVYRIKAG